MIARGILRIFVVGFAFFLSALISMTMLVILGGRELARLFTGTTEADPVFGLLFDIWGAILFAGAIGPAFTVLPALAAVIIAEVVRIRSVIYYMLTGGLAVLAIPLLYETEEGITGTVNTHYMILFSACGFIAGFVYWLIAGRKA